MDSKRLTGGIVGGLAGGVMFGALMHMMGMMGMPVFELGEVQLQSLMGHVLYGVTLGLVMHAFVQVSEQGRVASRA